MIYKLPKLRVLDGEPVTPVEQKRVEGRQIEPPLFAYRDQVLSPINVSFLFLSLPVSFALAPLASYNFLEIRFQFFVRARRLHVPLDVCPRAEGSRKGEVVWGR
jgi:hypothetical protein